MARGKQYKGSSWITVYSDTPQGKKAKAQFESGQKEELLVQGSTVVLKGDKTMAPFEIEHEDELIAKMASLVLEGDKTLAQFESGHEEELLAAVASEALKGDKTIAQFDSEPAKTPTKDKLRYKSVGPFLTKLLKKHSFPQVAALLGVPRMTLLRWRKHKKIRACHSSLIHRIEDAIKNTQDMPKRGRMNNEKALKVLEMARLHAGSWSALAKKLKVGKRTLIRWRKTGKISPGYRDIIYLYCEDYPELKSFRNGIVYASSEPQ